MAPEIEKKRRELFERIYSGIFDFTFAGVTDMHGRPVYRSTTVQSHWDGFNAALDAVEIELPSNFDNAPPYACYEGGWNDMREEAVDAITANGLGLRIK